MKRFLILACLAAVLVMFAGPTVRADVVTAGAGSGGVTKGTFVKLSAAGTIVTATAVGDSVVGICEQTASANALTKYALPGTKTVVTSGAAIAVGDLLTAGTGGKAFVLDTQEGSNQRYAAVALTAAATADLDVMVVLAAGSARVSPTVTFSAAAGASNVCNVTITVKNAAGTAIASPFILTVWLSDAATGVGLTGTSASGTVQAKSASGADLGPLTAKKALVVQTLATGVYILEITDTAKTAFYVCATVPGTGAIKISTQLATANYGT